MDRRMNSWMTEALLVLVLIFIPMAVTAQMGDDDKGREGMMGDGMMGGGGMGMHGMGMGGGMMEMMRMMKEASHLDLTADQKRQVQQLKLKHRKEAIPLLARIQTTEIELQELFLVDPINMEKVRAKMREKHDAMAELDLSHLFLMQQFKSLLTPEQRKRLESMMMEMGPMMGHQPGMGKERRGSRPESDMPNDTTPKADEPHGR